MQHKKCRHSGDGGGGRGEREGEGNTNLKKKNHLQPVSVLQDPFLLELLCDLVGAAVCWLCCP